MKPLRKYGHLPATVELLETRIAPATIITGVPDVLPGDDTNYDEAPFVNIATGTDPISMAIKGGDPGVNGTFYLRLTKGDVLKVWNDTNAAEDYLTVKAGQIVAFFIDKDADNEVDEGELVGISLGKGASIVVKNAIEGDILTNLDDKGTKDPSDDTLDMTGLVSVKHNINGIVIGGNQVGGSIIAGGTIQNVQVLGNVNAILTGTAADGRSFDLLPGVTGGGGTLAVTLAPGQKGPGITNIIVDDVIDRIEASAGGEGAAGGNIKNVQVLEDSTGLVIQAGKGGDGGSARKNGGAGGTISNVVISGIPDATPNDVVLIAAGAGGNSPANTGGKGGTVTSVFVGYQYVGRTVFPTLDLLADDVTILGGTGGDGKVGGKGGFVTKVDVKIATPDAAGDELMIRAGDGGANIVAAAGKAGAGGYLMNIAARNQILSPGAGILVQAGNGGATAGNATGGAGGSITNVDLLATNQTVLAGNGSDGKKGGAGGSIKGIDVETAAGVITRSAVFNAGSGGNGSAGAGGHGGNTSNIVISESDLNVLEFNSGTAANGGDSVGGKGGKGGSITNVEVFDGGLAGGITATYNVRAGDGGDGSKGGGAGGGIKTAKFVTLNMEGQIQGGAGGNVTGANAKGKGGAGGSVMAVEAVADSDPSAPFVSVIVRSGVGGDGAGSNGAGGAGADLRQVSVRATGSVSLQAGDGGSGTGGAAGKGGSVIISGAFGTIGSGSILAGNAGAGGAKPGNGGSVLGLAPDKLTGLFASDTLTIQAGNGTHGGAGGHVRYIGYGSSSSTLVPTPTGDITIQAGHGSAEGKRAGAGGNVDFVSGSVASQPNTVTLIAAGNGAGTAQKSSAGGSVSNIILERGGAVGAELRIDAGDGGDGGKTGGKGGSTRLVSVNGIDDGTIFRRVSAGDGGDGTNKGGIGGSIDSVRVLNHDIGVRTGEVYGFDTMGGLFAGAGGAGAKAGKAGNVTNVTADAIASIVAGKGASPQEVEKVENIYVVPGGRNLLHASEGAFLHAIPGGQMVLTFDGESTPAIPSGASPAQIAAALNSLTTVTAAGGVTVSALPDGRYTITFGDNGDVTQITGTQTFAIPVSEITPGTGPLAVVTVQNGNPLDSEIQSFTVGDAPQFTLTFGGQTTTTLSGTATAQEVEDALNALVGIGLVGGVTVADDGAGTYTITFNSPGDQVAIAGTAIVQETQFINVISEGSFTISFEGDSTGVLAGNATAAEVETALNGLPSVTAAGGVTVAAAPGGAYRITFVTPGAQSDFTAAGALDVGGITVAEGTAGTREVQSIRGLTYFFDPVNYGVTYFSGSANFVGAIYDIFEVDAWAFNFIKAGVETDSRTSDFALGDIPIDGILVAKVFNQAKSNFTPEAKLVGGVFYDFDNRI